MKGKLGVLMLVLLFASYFVEKYAGHRSPVKEETSDVITVTGRITNKENGNAIAKALVEVQASPAKTRTDDNGGYSIPAKKGELLVISHSKYRRITVEVEEEMQDVQLTPQK